MKMKIHTLLVSITVLLPLFLEAHNFPFPSASAGVVEREIEREYESPKLDPKVLPIIELETPDETFELCDDETIFVRQLIFHGHTIFSCEQLERFTAEKINCESCMNDLNAICWVIQQEYVKHGYLLARAYVPVQEVSDGILHIEILEGVLGDVFVEGNRYYSTKFIGDYLSPMQGMPINYDRLLRAILLINENINLQVGVVLKRGTERGCADIILQVMDRIPIHGFVDLNNYGNRFVTEWRTGSRVDCGCLFQEGDLISIATVVGYPITELQFFDGIYDLPINKGGTTLELSYLYSDFLVSELTSLLFKGRAQVATIKLKQALERTRTMNTNLFLSFDYKELKNFTIHNLFTADKLRVLGIGYSIDWADCYGRSFLEVAGYVGIPDFLHGSRAIDPMASRDGAGGRFIVGDIDFKRIQYLNEDMFLLLAFEGQLTPGKLTLPEQIYIGGFDTVRGYPAAFALGDYGFSASVEARIAPKEFDCYKVPFCDLSWKEFIQFVAFIDHGEVYNFGAPRENIVLTSSGVGLRLFAPYNLNISFDVALPWNHFQGVTNGVTPAVIYFKICWQFL